MNRKIKTILFDYGGTIDTDGIHWSEKFWDAYQKFHIKVEKKDFRDAFVYSERIISKIIKPDFNLKETYETQINHQLEYLENAELLSGFSYVLTESLSDYCLESVLENIEYNRPILNNLSQFYELGIISNYYGNLENVLNETAIRKYFRAVFDSAIVGIRKPDKKIFELALEELDIRPAECLVVGDSYTNDIAPAKAIGCKTVWLKGKGWNDLIDTINFDVSIKSLKELLNTIKTL